MPLPPPRPPNPSDRECAICHEWLLEPTTDDPLQPSYILDDAELPCGHRFHQSCLVEYATSSAEARQRCALCRQSIAGANGAFWVTVRTEHGFRSRFDLGEEIDRLAYLQAHPSVDRAETFLSLISQMEFEDAEAFLKGEDEGFEGCPLDPDVPYSTGGTTALQMAALNNDTEGTRLLLRYQAQVDKQDDDGETALSLARKAGAEDVVALLSTAV